MTLPASPFSGSNFFAMVRPRMDTNRGLFGGSDGNLQYVIMDAVLYRPEIFRRPSAQTFTAAGTSLGADVRVLVNGQLFGRRGKLDYCYLSPCAVQWEGEIVDAGVTVAGNPASQSSHRFFGRENAIPVWRNYVGQGDPSRFYPKLQYAMGSLIPLIQGRVRFGNGNVGVPPNPRQRHSNATASWLNFRATVGKTAVGIHRDSGCLFVICQENSAAHGLDVTTLITRFQAMNVDDAALCDGSDSATLIVDRVVHAAPGYIKNNSIPTGLMFRLNDVPFGAGGTIQIDAASTDATFLNIFPAGSSLTGIAGTINARSTGGLELNLTSFGSSPPLSAQDVANLMEVGSLPIRLLAPDTDLTSGSAFAVAGSPALVRFQLRVIHTPNQYDRLNGSLRITNSRGAIVGAVTVPI